jgi:predicted secreted protein
LVRAIPNYSLTYSLAESNDSHAAEALAAGVNVAAVFDTRKSADLPQTFTIAGITARVIDGDASDLRFLDPNTGGGWPGNIVGLRAKGRAKRDTSGFVRRVAA